MFPLLLEIFGDKVLERVQTYDVKRYYYFYKDVQTKEVFGILKTITPGEYALLQSMYVSKVLYHKDEVVQKMYEYILEDAPYPFENKKVRLLFVQASEEIQQMVVAFLQEIYPFVKSLTIQNLCVIMYEEVSDIKTKEIFTTLSDDIGSKIFVHQGIHCSEQLSGKEVYRYIRFYLDSKATKTKQYSDVADLFFDCEAASFFEYLAIIKRAYQHILLADVKTKEILSVFFKNDLNVSLSAKQLYMHRNSLLNKLDSIYKETGFDVQTFRHAAVVYQILKSHQVFGGQIV